VQHSCQLHCLALRATLIETTDELKNVISQPCQPTSLS
jgi:hypothetical protein